MKIQSSTIVSFLTGRLYSTTPPTILFADLYQSLLGTNRPIGTHEMRAIKDAYSNTLLRQLPKELQSAITNWQHMADWQTRIDLIDEAFGQIEIYPATH